MINLHDKAVTEVLPKIGPKNFAVLIVIVKHLGQNNQAFPSIPRIMRMTKMGRDSVISAIKELVKFKLISKSQRHVKGRFSSNIYKVKTPHFSVFIKAKDAGSLEEKQGTENQGTEKQYTEKQYTENQGTENQGTENQGTENPTVSIEQYIEVLNSSSEVLNKGGSIFLRGEESATQKNISPSSKKENYSKLDEENNVQKEKNSAKKEKVFFSDSGYSAEDGISKLDEDLKKIKPDYEFVDSEFYLTSVLNWSRGKGILQLDWLTMVERFILTDIKSNKLKLKNNVKQKTNSASKLEQLNRELAKHGF